MLIWLNRQFHRLFDLKLGLLALPIIGGMVTAINWHHGLREAFSAGAWAGLTGIALTGWLTRTIKGCAEWKKRPLAYLVGTGFPTCVNALSHLSGQSLNSTPELWWSVAAPSLLTFVSSIGLNMGTHYFLIHPLPSGWLGKLCHYIFSIPGRSQP